ncbi:MAG: MFS transporter [Deltaproteobacteria bacterium]|jgi:MFS family permease|nr:MAG: MFS transporter [Deltaproteobacteria bacterium]
MITREIFTRDFILCFAAQVAFASVSFILIPTLPIYLSRLGSAEIEIGILIGAFGISSLLLRPVVGKALSKSGEKKFMVVGAIVSALTSMAYLIAPPFWPFFIVRILQGIGSAFFFTATIILISNITPQTHRGESLGYFFLSFNISMVLAPPFGIFLINHFGFTTLFLVCVFLSLGALLISCRLRSSEVKPIVDSSIEDSSFFTPKAFPPIFVYFLAHIIWGALATFFPLHAINHGVTNPGLFFAAYAMVLILGRALGGRILDTYQRDKVILPCLTAYILSMTLLAYSTSLQMFILVAIIQATGHAFLMPALVAYTIDHAGASRGASIGLLSAAGDLGMVLGPTMMGIILRFSSFPAMFLCLALIGLMNFTYFYFSMKKRKKLAG